MSRQNYHRRQRGNHSQQGDFYSHNGNQGVVAIPNYSQPYSYPSECYDYYGYPYTNNHVYQPPDYWFRDGVNYNYSIIPEVVPTIPSPYAETPSIFSADAPEFVSQQNYTSDAVVVANDFPKVAKKRKNRKKKKTNSSATVMLEPINVVQEEEKKTLLVSERGKNESSVKNVEKVKTVRFKESSLTEKTTLQTKNSETTSSPVNKHVVDNLWPQPSEFADKSKEMLSATPKMSFADKLKAPSCPSSPFLDWRDQRTKASSEPPKPNIDTPTLGKSKDTKKPLHINATDNSSLSDGFITVSRKKSKGKIQQTLEPASEPPSSGVKMINKTAEDQEKRKQEKEKKKLREKEKKRREREGKILADKLAPKSQKVTIITPKMMEKFLQSSQSKAPIKPIIQLNEEMFPALGKPDGNISIANESESEWETTEIEVVKKEPAVTQRNVKRFDPIEFDLMALITKKTTKKKPVNGPDSKKSKSRPGLVANVLDRSAPTLSRGKIRNKKRKLSEIRKALLAAKAKKIAARESQVSTIPSSGTRPHVLHSKKFREYCDQMLTDQIDLLARDMLYHLRMFQDRVFKKDPIKAKMKKRLVAGLREVTKQVERNRIKIIFLAPDIQRCPETGGLDEAVKRLLDIARQKDLPIVYALSRRKLGRVLMKKVPVSCCGVFNYQATEETWKLLIKDVSQARDEYQLKLQQLGLIDAPQKETNDGDVKDKPTVPVIIPQPAQTDGLLELMKLSLKDEI